MVYSFKEYKTVFDTPMKKQQELAIARKIMDLLNKNKYDDLEEFITKNNNYQDFLKNNNMQTVIKHFGNTLKEEDYIKILENLRVLTKNKQDFDKENIKTTNLDNKQYNTFEGEDKTYFIDNSTGDKKIEDQMKDLQNSGQVFQTSDMKQNTENMFKNLEKKKNTLNLQDLTTINYDSLNDEEKEMYKLAQDYYLKDNGSIRVDFQRGIIVTEDNEILKIQRNEDGISIIKQENNNEVEVEQKTDDKTYQKTLTPSVNTIYSN